MFDYATRSITGPVSPSSTIPRAIAAMSHYASAATRTVVPCAASQTDCSTWLASSCSDRRRLTRSLVSRLHNKQVGGSTPANTCLLSSFGWSAVSPPRPEDRQRAARSGGQDWPQATVRREAVLTAASTARASIRSEALSTKAAVVHRYTVRIRNNARRGVTAPAILFPPLTIGRKSTFWTLPPAALLRLLERWRAEAIKTGRTIGRFMRRDVTGSGWRDLARSVVDARAGRDGGDIGG